MDKIDVNNEPKQAPKPVGDVSKLVSMDPSKMVKQIESKKGMIKTLSAIVLAALLLGVSTGYVVAFVNSKRAQKAGSPTLSKGAQEKMVDTESEAGINDEEAFPDTAQGVLKEGGIDGEGTHYLDRDLGEEKYVYLTSTVINLQSFVGKKVEVRGQTISGKKAGWLMDVGKVKVIE